MIKYNKQKIDGGNKWYDQWMNVDHPREPVFLEVLNVFNNQPIDILEIGTTYDKNDPQAIKGSGFSTFYWADYIKQNGGSLTIVDINPVAIENCKLMIDDFVKAGINVKFVCGDGLDCLKKDNNYQLVYLDGGDQEYETFEMFRQINRTKTKVLCDDANGWDRGVGKCVRLRKYYRDYSVRPCGVSHEMIIYDVIKGNDEKFKIGDLELNYYRENANSAWRNERSVELGLGNWFANKYLQIVELGAVCYQYSFFNNWEVVDPYDNGYPCIRADILDYNYTNKSLLSISTIEHCGIDGGYNQPIVKDLAIKGLEKIVKESKEYLITFPVGANRELEDYLKNQTAIKYTFMVRDSKRGETNNWHQENNPNLFYENYLHFEYDLDYYGSAYVVCVVTNQDELLGKVPTNS